jgi:hypothetical protein
MPNAERPHAAPAINTPDGAVRLRRCSSMARPWAHQSPWCLEQLTPPSACQPSRLAPSATTPSPSPTCPAPALWPQSRRPARASLLALHRPSLQSPSRPRPRRPAVHAPSPSLLSHTRTAASGARLCILLSQGLSPLVCCAGTVTVSGNVTSTGTGVPSGTVSVTVRGALHPSMQLLEPAGSARCTFPPLC